MSDHGTSLSIRIRYSQNRLTGHDFLDIGTGNFSSTNYPEHPIESYTPMKLLKAAVVEYSLLQLTQDGNFRVGDLFNVEQATGIASECRCI